MMGARFRDGDLGGTDFGRRRHLFLFFPLSFDLWALGFGSLADDGCSFQGWRPWRHRLRSPEAPFLGVFLTSVLFS